MPDLGGQYDWNIQHFNRFLFYTLWTLCFTLWVHFVLHFNKKGETIFLSTDFTNGINFFRDQKSEGRSYSYSRLPTPDFILLDTLRKKMKNKIDIWKVESNNFAASDIIRVLPEFNFCSLQSKLSSLPE